MPVDHQQVRPGVIVVIEEGYTPTEISCHGPETGGSRHLGEGAISVVAIDIRCVVDEVRFREIDVPVAVIIARRGSHARLLAAVFTVGDTCFDAGVCERSVVIVAIKDACLRVHRNIGVGPPVIVRI